MKPTKIIKFQFDMCGVSNVEQLCNLNSLSQLSNYAETENLRISIIKLRNF
jgi:hypothetical protein